MDRRPEPTFLAKSQGLQWRRPAVATRRRPDGVRRLPAGILACSILPKPYSAYPRNLDFAGLGRRLSGNSYGADLRSELG